MSIDCDVQKLASVANKEYTPGDKEDAVNEFKTIEEPFSNQEVVKPPIPPVLVTFIEPSSEFKQLEFYKTKFKIVSYDKNFKSIT